MTDTVCQGMSPGERETEMTIVYWWSERGGEAGGVWEWAVKRRHYGLGRCEKREGSVRWNCSWCE